MTQDDKHEQQLKTNGRRDEKIHTNHVRHRILDEGSPGLRWRFPFAPVQQSRQTSLGDYDAKLVQLAVNLGRPQSGLASAIMRISTLISESNAGLPCRLAWDFQRQESLKALLCQRTKVSGCTIRRASRHPDQTCDINTQNSRSRPFNAGRF